MQLLHNLAKVAESNRKWDMGEKTDLDLKNALIYRSEITDSQACLYPKTKTISQGPSQKHLNIWFNINWGRGRPKQINRVASSPGQPSHVSPFKTTPWLKEIESVSSHTAPDVL